MSKLQTPQRQGKYQGKPYSCILQELTVTKPSIYNLKENTNLWHNLSQLNRIKENNKNSLIYQIQIWQTFCQLLLASGQLAGDKLGGNQYFLQVMKDSVYFLKFIIINSGNVHCKYQPVSVFRLHSATKRTKRKTHYKRQSTNKGSSFDQM